MKEYESKSVEELRCEDYLAGRKTGAAGGAATTGGLFGTATSTASNTNTFGFGSNTNTNTSGGLFGSTNNTGTTSLFGNTNNNKVTSCHSHWTACTFSVLSM